MEFIADNFGILLISAIVVLALREYCKPKMNTTKKQVANNMAETQKLIEFLKTCSDEEAMNRWADVHRYVSILSPSEHHALTWALAHVDRGNGSAGRLVAWVRSESALLYDMAWTRCPRQLKRPTSVGRFFFCYTTPIWQLKFRQTIRERLNR